MSTTYTRAVKDIKRLSKDGFLRNGENVVLFGSFGLGKTHILLGLIEKLCENNFKCYFINTSSLTEKLLSRNKGIKK